MIITTIVLAISLSACGDYYEKLNQMITEIEYEEEGYTIFTAYDKVDGESRISLENYLRNLFIENEISFEFITFDYVLINDLLHFNINYKIDKNDFKTKAIIAVEASELNVVLFETIFEGKNGVTIDVDINNNIIIYDKNSEKIKLYTYSNSNYQNEEFERDEFDYSNYTLTSLDKIIRNERVYFVNSYNSKLRLEDKTGQIYYEIDYFELFIKSHVGSKIYDYSVSINKELRLDYYDVFVYQNELFISYQFNAGLLFNKSLLGETKELIFRFNYDTKSLVYIGSDRYVRAIYF